MPKLGRTPILAAVIVFGMSACVSTSSMAADPDALLKIVTQQCIPDQKNNHKPDPCALVDLARGTTVFKDQVGITQFLLIPTDRVTGIEDPKVLSARSPNYWEAAWEARHFAEERSPAPLSADEISLAINSKFSRSQNQLHIHVDCLRPDVRDALRLNQKRVGARWTKVTLIGQEFAERWISAQDLKTRNLFVIVARRLKPGQKMDKEDMVVTGAIRADGVAGFNLLVGRRDVGSNRGSGEALQDHDCAIAKQASR